MTRALLGSFSSASIVNGELEKGLSPLLSASALDFWTEHSPRSAMPSWVACLATFPAEWPELLGRWGASVAEGYVCTHRKRVTLMQESVASKFRASLDPHSVFDDGELFEQRETYLRKRGLDDDAISNQLVPLALDFRPLLG